MKHAALLLLPILSGCAQSVDAPSLLPRAAELMTPPAPAAPPPVCEDTAFEARSAGLRQRAAAAATKFDPAIARARTQAARESDAWIEAQNARSVAALAHGDLIDVQSSLDDVVRGLQGPGCTPEIYDALRNEIASQIARQQAQLDALGD